MSAPSFSPSTIIVDFKTTTKNISGLKENRHKVRRIQNFSSLNDSVSAILLRLWSVGITFCVYKVDVSICIVLFITYVSCLMICYLHCLGDSWETKFIFPVLWLSQVLQRLYYSNNWIHLIIIYGIGQNNPTSFSKEVRV